MADASVLQHRLDAVERAIAALRRGASINIVGLAGESLWLGPLIAVALDPPLVVPEITANLEAQAQRLEEQLAALDG